MNRSLLLMSLLAVAAVAIAAYVVLSQPGGGNSVTYDLPSAATVDQAPAPLPSGSEAEPPASPPVPAPSPTPLATPDPTPAPPTSWSPTRCEQAEQWLDFETQADLNNRPPTLTAADRRALDTWSQKWATMSVLVRIAACGNGQPISTAPNPPIIFYAQDPPHVTPAGCQWAEMLLSQAIALHQAAIGRPVLWPGDSQQREDQWNRDSITGYSQVLDSFEIGCSSQPSAG